MSEAPAGRAPSPTAAAALALTLALAFALRVVAGLHARDASVGYLFFLDTARQIVEHGYSLRGVDLGGRPPLYPYLLALVGPGGGPAVRIVVQSAIGTATVACAYLIGREIFSPRVGTLAAVGTALYPYFVVHDSAIQETSLVTLLSAIAPYVVLVAVRRRSAWLAVAAGALLAAGALTRLTMLAFAALTIGWLAAWSVRDRRTRLRLAGAAAAPIALAVALWFGWESHTGGSATADGIANQLWRAHNPATFSAYPDSSIDLSTRNAFRMLDSAERVELLAARRDPRRLDAWYLHRAWLFVRAHPALAVWHSLRMVATGFSWRLSPRAGPAKELVYALTYTPAFLLGVAGLVRSRRRWRELGVIHANFLGFIGITLVFWAHTSHRVHLDVLLIVFAASVVERWLPGATAAAHHARDDADSNVLPAT